MRRTGETSRTAPDGTSVPAWLRPIVRASAEMGAEQLSPQLPGPPPDARRSAVLMLFGDRDDDPAGAVGAPAGDLLLTERSHTMRSHAGQVSFPGGSIDASDADEVAAALREAYEEVGVEPSGVDVVGLLPALWLPPSNFSVTTVVAHWRRPVPVRPVDPAEVRTVVRVPVRDLVDPANRFSVRHPSGWVGPAFRVADDLLLWGFTAGIVSRLFAHAGWERPWDASRLEPLPDRLARPDPVLDELTDRTAEPGR